MTRENRRATLLALRELINALDGRLPHVERAGETWIAREAQRLRAEALRRIEQVTRAESCENVYDQDLVEAIMTDDGSPLQRRESRALYLH